MAADLWEVMSLLFGCQPAHLCLRHPLGRAALQQDLLLQRDLLAQRFLVKVLPEIWRGKEYPGVTKLLWKQGNLQNLGGERASPRHQEHTSREMPLVQHSWSKTCPRRKELNKHLPGGIQDSTWCLSTMPFLLHALTSL